MNALSDIINPETKEPYSVLQLMKTLEQRKAQRESMVAFFKRAFTVVDPATEYLHNWHVDLICEHLEACYEKEILKLVINIPPRSLKSNITTVGFPAWVLGKDPAERFVCSSYSNKLSIKHSVDTRLIMQSEWYRNLFPDTILAHDQNEKMKFQTTEMGHRIATSIGGTATGEGGNYLITDDPINPKMAMSDKERETTNEWLDQTWSSRKNNPKTAVEIMVMQRLHIDDPTGHLRKEKGWVSVVLPQEAEKKTIIIFPRSKKEIIRSKGDLLHPERNGVKQIAEMKTRLGTYGYASQQQQRPAPKGGGMCKIKWFGRFDAKPASPQKITLSLDTANKDKEQNDPSVCGVFLEYKNFYYLVDVWRDKVLYPDLKRAVKGLIDKWKPHEVLIEDKGSGQQLIQDLKRESKSGIIASEPQGIDKVTRFAVETPTIEAGHVLLPNNAPWLFDYEQEIMNFPNVTNDDQVDMTSQFLKRNRQPAEIFVG